MCHEPPAANRSVFPDLRYSPMLNTPEAFSAVVLEGALQANGMASFKDRLTPEECGVRARLPHRSSSSGQGVSDTTALGGTVIATRLGLEAGSTA